jgi:RimJ/RimL family protein N-acetyltransferase
MPADPPTPVVLRGEWIRLEPLGFEHVPALTVATAGDGQIWEWMPAFPADEAGMSAVVRQALDERDHGTRFPFAVIDRRTEQAVGSSSYLDIDPANDRIEIGWTWLAQSVWRSPVNTEAKLLLLGHAFDTLGYERVALKTHHLNRRSQAAIARLGAVPEGTLRHHVRHRDGTWRDTVYFSVLSAEWPAVRESLRARLAT